MMTLANKSRRVVVPSGPMSGNSVLASDAPDWIEAMAISSTPTGKERSGEAAGLSVHCEVAVLLEEEVRMRL